NYAADERVIDIAIVGAGATGVELAAELHNTIRVLTAYGLASFDPARQIRLTILEAGPRILPGLPEHIMKGALATLDSLGVQVFVGDPVVEVGPDKVRTKSGREMRADFTVWAAGIRCPDVLRDLGGLESNRANQLVTLPTLQT